MSNKLGTVVIGAGPGGYSAAIRASQYGQDVTIIEKEYFGGVCLNVGCIPAKTLMAASSNFETVVKGAKAYGIHANDVELKWDEVLAKKDDAVNSMTKGVEALLNKNKVNIIEGEAHLLDNETLEVNGETYTFENLIIATGSRIPDDENFPWGGRILNTTTAQRASAPPSSVVLTRAGYLGSQYSGLFARFGVEVTLLTEGDDILPGVAKDVNKTLERKFGEYNFTQIKQATPTRATDNGDSATVYYTDADGQEQSVTADVVIHNAVRVPNTDGLGLENTDIELKEDGRIQVDEDQKTNVPNIYAIGDVANGIYAGEAYTHAKRAAADIAGREKKDHKVFPVSLVSALEFGQVGMTRDEAKEAGYKAKQTKFMAAANGRATTLDKTDGFMKVIYDDETKDILGFEIIGEKATDLINQAAQIVEEGMKLEDVSDTIFSHPTLSEGILDLTESALGLGIHG